MWKLGGLTVSEFDFGSSVPGSSPGQGRCVVFFGSVLTLTVPLPTQVCEWVPANLMLRGNPAVKRGGVQMLLGGINAPGRFMLRKPEICAGLMGRMVRMRTSPLTCYGLVLGVRLCYNLKHHLTLSQHV